MITEPTNKSKEAMEAKTLAIPPRERTGEGGLPSGGEVGQVVTKTAGGAAWEDIPQELPDLEGSDAGDVLTNIGNNKTAWAPNHDVPSGGSDGQVLTKMSNDNHAVGWKNAPAAPLMKSASVINRIRIKVDNFTENNLPANVGDDVSVPITAVIMPSVRDGLFMSQYEEGAYFDGLLGAQIFYIDPEDPDEIPMPIITKDLTPFNIQCAPDDEIQLNFTVFYIVDSHKLYKVYIPTIVRTGNNQWEVHSGDEIYIECVMESA